MNTFELALFLLCIAAGYFGGKLLSLYWGAVGWIVGFAIGGSLLGTAFRLVLYYSNKWFPIHPACRNGKCTDRDYVLVQYNEEEGTFVWRCKCGTEYYQDLPYFKEVLPDGSLRPYMKKNRWGKWEPDTE